MESNKLLIQSRGKPAMIKSINVKVPGAFSRKGIGPIMAPSANLYEHIDIQQRTQISRRHHVNIPRRSSFHLNNYFIKQNNSYIVKNRWSQQLNKYKLNNSCEILFTITKMRRSIKINTHLKHMNERITKIIYNNTKNK